MRIILLFVTALSINIAYADSKIKADSAIIKVENCVCYKHQDAKNIKSWDIDWDDTEKLRKLISHCICSAHIDMQKVENPRRYIYPGIKLK